MCLEVLSWKLRRKIRNEVWGALCAQIAKSTRSWASSWFLWQQLHCTCLVDFTEINQNKTTWLISPNASQEASTEMERANGLQGNHGRLSREGCQRLRAQNLISVIEMHLLRILSRYATTLEVLQFLLRYVVETSLPLFSPKDAVMVLLLQVSTNHCGHSIQR